MTIMKTAVHIGLYGGGY